MLDHPLPDLDTWVRRFTSDSLPVLRITQRNLEELRGNLEQVEARELSRLILHDPLMTARVLAYTQPMRSRNLQCDITTVGTAIMMAGIEPFFAHFSELPTIEDRLHSTGSQTLLGVLHIIRRAQRAADYAQEWATWRHDLHLEEIRIAALLHDLAEILVWCSAPALGIEINRRLTIEPGLHSTDAQRAILGFTFNELQRELCRIWQLPPLLQELIDDGDNPSLTPRVRNVSLAVRLARHSSYGWDNPALPDDYAAIATLLHVSTETVCQRLGLLPVPAREADGREMLA